jgi:AcrR family transcriptional regulator
MDKKNEILEVTFELFTEKGYQASMSDIAKKVKLKTPSLYSHFENKEEIMDIVIRREIYSFFTELENKLISLLDVEVEKALREAYFFILDYYSDKGRIRFWRNISLINNLELREKSREYIQKRELIIAKLTKQIFEKGTREKIIREECSEGCFFLYLAMIQGVLDGMLLYDDNSGIDMEVFINGVWNSYWQGISSGR